MKTFRDHNYPETAPTFSVIETTLLAICSCIFGYYLGKGHGWLSSLLHAIIPPLVGLALGFLWILWDKYKTKKSETEETQE